MSNSTGNPVIPGFTGTWNDVLAITWASEFAGVASAALLAFDVLLTLEQEIRLVWNGRFGIPVILYFLNRYGTMIQACLNIVTDLDQTLSLDECLSWNLFWNWSIPLVMAVVEATMTLRVIALWEGKRSISIPLWIWYVMNIAVMFTMMGLSMQGAVPSASPAPPIIGCVITTPLSYYWQLYLPSLVYETTIAGLTLWKALEHKRLLSSVPLLYVLIRDGFFYFFIVFAVMLINLVIDLTANVLYFDWTPQLSIAIASCVSVRLFLNLREVAASGKSQTDYSSGLFEMGTMPSVPSTYRTRTSRATTSTRPSQLESGDTKQDDEGSDMIAVAR